MFTLKRVHFGLKKSRETKTKLNKKKKIKLRNNKYHVCYRLIAQITGKSVNNSF